MPSLISRAVRWRGLRLVVLGSALVGLPALAWWQVGVRGPRFREREARAAIARGRDFLQQGQPVQALRAVDGIPEEGPWAAELLTVQGLARAAFDQPLEARPLLERALKLDPNQPMAAKVLAAIYFHANETDRGFGMLELAARLDPHDFRPWFATGDMILTLHLPPAGAVRAFQEALRRRPDHDESRTGLIDALLATGSVAEAAPLLEGALRDHPHDPRILCLAARHARLAGRPEEMNRLAEQTLDLDPNNAEARVFRAQYLHMTGRRQEALRHAEAAVALAPNDLAALSLLAQIEGALGLKERSTATSSRHREIQKRAKRIHELTDEMKRRPDDPEPRWRMGQVAAEGGMTTLAVTSFRAALALDPRCEPARRGLAALQGPLARAPLPAAGPPSISP